MSNPVVFASQPRTILEYRTTPLIRGEPLRVDFDFDISDGRNVFTLLVRVLDPADEQTIIYQRQKQFTYPEGEGYVSNSFEISSFYTNVSTFMFNFKVYGSRSGLHVDAGYFSHGAEFKEETGRKYHSLRMTYGLVYDPKRVAFQSSIDKPIRLEDKYRALKFANPDFRMGGRVCEMANLKFEVTSTSFELPSSFNAELWIYDKQGIFSIGNRAGVGSNVHIEIPVTARIDSRNGDVAKYTFRTTRTYIASKANLRMDDYSGSVPMNWFKTNDVYFPAGVEFADGKPPRCEIRIGEVSPYGDSFIVDVSSPSFLYDAGECATRSTCVVLGEERP